MGSLLHGVGILVMAVGGALAFSRALPRPAWFWGARDPFTGEPAPATRVAGTGLVATGTGLALLSWLGTPAGLWAGVVGVAFTGLGAVLQLWAAQMHRAGA